MGDTKKKAFYYRKSRNKYFLEPGFRGFFCTCNFREKDCVKEAYNILNEYAEILYPNLAANEIANKAAVTKTADENLSETDSEDETEIGDVLRRELETMKKETQKSLRHKRFQAVETGASNCVFIKTNLPCPEDITSAIFKDLYISKVQKSRHLLRLLPIMATCKANLPDIMECAGKLFDKYFLKQSCTFAIVFNKRFNSSASRELVIKELADMIVLKNNDNKADLRNPKLSVIVEIIKGICLLSVVDNYFAYKKYNMIEICKEDVKTTEEVKPKKVKSEDSESINESVAAQ